MRTACLLALAFLISVSATAAPVNVGAGSAPFEHVFAEFRSARDALLQRPEATLSDYLRLVGESAARLDPGSLSLDELARGSFEGLFDLPPVRAGAAARTASFQAPDSLDGARAAAVRLRLLGNVTLEGAPDAQAQAGPVQELLEHQHLPALLASAHGIEVIDALIGVGRADVLRRFTPRIVALLHGLDPRVSPGLAAGLGRLELLLALAVPDEATLAPEERHLIEFGHRALQYLPETERRAAEREVARLERLFEPTRKTNVAPTAPYARGGTDAEPESDASGHRLAEFIEGLGGELLESVEASARVGGSIAVRFKSGTPRQRTILRLSDSWYERSHTTITRAERAVVAGGGHALRAFGGVRIEDPAFRILAADFGYDRRDSSGFARELSFRGSMLDIRSDRLTVRGDEATVDRARIRLRPLGLSLMGFDAGRLSRDREKRVHVEEGSVRLFGLRVYGVRSLTTSAGPDPPREETSPTPRETSRPRGVSPIWQWLQPPSIGLFDGGLSIGYNNTLKFSGRWTGILGFRLATSTDPSLRLGANYNLLAITNDTDEFIRAENLQNQSYGSYYFNILPQDPVQENQRLFQPALIVGAATAWNISYADEDGDRNDADQPFSVGIGGGGPIGRVLGFRGQVTYERVEDKGFGTDTRLAVAGVLGPPSVEIARGVQLFLRGDGITRFGGSDTYTWSRASAGLSLLPIPQVRLSSAYYQSWEWGTPRFPYDRVSRDHGVTARVDLTVGATCVGYMNQYSSRRSGWVRGQVYLARRIGITEPFVAYDEQFNRVSLGVNLDTTALLDGLFRRRVTGVETPSR